MPSLVLRARPVFDLQPGVAVVLVNAEFPLRHNALKVAGTNFSEEFFAFALDVLRIEQPWTLRGPDKPRKSLLSLDKGPLPQILAV